MRRVVIDVITSLMAFSAGVSTAYWWQSSPPKTHPQPPSINVQTPPITLAPPPPVEPPGSQSERTRDAIFAKSRLRIVPEETTLKSERLRYEIDVVYPQIVGSNEPYIQRLNQRLKQLASATYQWQLKPSPADLRRWKDHAEFNSIDLDYDVVLATDSLLSIYFDGSSYGIGAAHGVQFSFTVNYDLNEHRELQLFELFKPQSKFLKFIQEYCRDELTRSLGSVFPEEVRRISTYKSWNLINDGLRFNFDSCAVAACSAGAQSVSIPYNTLKPWLTGQFHAKAQR